MIAPSILSADFSNLFSEIREIEKYGATWFHVDVMDGHFVPNITMGPGIVDSIREKTKSVLDCHLMVDNPERVVPWFLKGGANYVTFHLESTRNPLELLNIIRASGKKAGISIKPETPVESLKDLLSAADLILVMSVEPGFGGQIFMPNSLHKIKWLAAKKIEHQYPYLIEIDGGINTFTAEAASSAGAEVFVAGSAIFNTKNRKKAFDDLVKATRLIPN
jgi:ribulose-phosphate 3-epimerase